MSLVLKAGFTFLVLLLASWLASRKTALAGFIVALPLSTMVVLPLTQAQHHSTALTLELAKSILVAIPFSLLFFVPFFLAERLQWGFWTTYLAGVALLGVGYFLHQMIMSWF